MAATFSYAQAAKGISSPVSVSKPASGSATPAKDDATKAPITSTSQVNSWADDAETESSTEQPATNGESRTTNSKPTESLEASTADLDSLSASTATKDDDVSSQANMSSESTWDNKSQASTSVDKTVEPVQKTLEKPEKGEKGRRGKKGEKGEKKEPEKEKEPPKPLKEAPLPTVNIWQQRADQQKTAKPAVSPLANGAPKKSSSEERPATAEKKPKTREEDKATLVRKDTRNDTDKKSTKSRPYDKDARPSSAMPLPPNQDQEAWPTPDTAVDEDRKKAQEKSEKERKDSAPNGTSGKHEWVKVPYTPSVVFSTPLPNAANSRRGGRPGGRGGAQSGGRAAALSANGVSAFEKDASSADATPNGEQPKREVNGAVVESSPKTRRSGSAASPTLREQVPAINGEKSLKGPGAAPFEPEAPKRASTMTEASAQNGTFPRQYSGRPAKGRRGDFNGSERRKDGDVSPTKDTTQTDGHENERRPFEGSNGIQGKQGRYSGSYGGGRDRPRGGGRGGRGGFANGHPFANGHAQQSSGSFSMGSGSPTTFSPGNNAFFTAPQGKFGRNSHRSQSVTEPYRYPTFQGAPQMAQAPYNMYDYNMMAPMSAVPYNPYSLDQFSLFQMITTQVEYYFSVDNLLKDMYLRRHMDSQGFVSLEFIAAFNRIKSLSTDIELLKLVCQQSSHVQYRTGEDGRDRLRRRDGWEHWVLAMADRDESAQNEGPKELHNPPVPNPAGFDQSNPPQYPTVQTGYGQDVSVPNIPQDAAAAPTGDLTNGTSTEGANGTVVPNGQPIEESTKA